MSIPIETHDFALQETLRKAMNQVARDQELRYCLTHVPLGHLQKKGKACDLHPSSEAEVDHVGMRRSHTSRQAQSIRDRQQRR